MPEFVRKIIKSELPDGVYATFGGQAAIRDGIALEDEFEGLGCRVLGTPIQTVGTTEDRQLFEDAIAEIGEHCAESASAATLDEACAVAKSIAFPAIACLVYPLG